jgi:polysaccharide export outer membrane protein
VKTRQCAIALVLAVAAASSAFAQQAQGRSNNAAAANPKAGGAVAPSGMVTPDDYVIGPDDQLSVVFWKDKDMSADVTVRPDGKISLPVLNEVAAAGLTAEQLRARITEAATKFVTDPTVSIVVKAINSRKVFITGMVAHPGDYSIPGRTTVLHEFADAKNITINRNDNGRQVTLRFNYKDVSKGKNLRQNIELKPGDTVIVP